VMPNLYGDVLSDVAAQIAGSVGLAGSANIGEQCAMFEAIHGSAPRRAGQDLANPSGLLLGAVMMLVHIGQGDVAELVHNAWLTTIEQGVATYDIASEREKSVGTRAFADAVIARLGQAPGELPGVSYPAGEAPIEISLNEPAPASKRLDGIDVFVHRSDRDPDALAAKLNEAAAGAFLQLRMVTNRGVKVWPDGIPETFCTDHWRCRFLVPGEGTAHRSHVIELLHRLDRAGVDFVKTEGLYRFDGDPGYSLGQGQ
jgi:isocitrate dehydrogenase